jgi:hypothetical protein
MSVMSSTARLIGAAGVAVAFAVAPVAAADPADLVPTCTGDENPQFDHCNAGCMQGAPIDAYGNCGQPGTALESTSDAQGTGANPNVPLGPQ